MALTELTRDQILAYYQARLEGIRRSGREFAARCPFHQDRAPSLTFNPDKGGAWRCHTCSVGGMLVDFEQKFSDCDRSQARENIAELIGLKSARKPEATYEYTDEDGRLLFQVLRYRRPDGKKEIRQRRPDGKGGWVWSLDQNVRRVLYRLPEVLTANTIILTEGEKDCDRARQLLADRRADNTILACSTNPGGAGGWREEFSPYFTGKKVVIFQDNDEPGIRHAQRVAQSLYPYTKAIRVVSPPQHDLGDWIDSGANADDLIALVKKTPLWTPPQEAYGFFVDAEKFAAITNGDDVDWAVEGLIERNSNGMVVAPPRGGKSFLTLSLALHMALGLPFLGHEIPRPLRVGYVSREDSPARTARRLRWLRRGLEGDGGRIDLTGHLWLNTKQQTKRLMLDIPDELAELRENVTARGIEFLFLDVFNRLHSADENDNTAMRRVLEQVETIGCPVVLIHHIAKSQQEGPLVLRARGASAIAGWAEFIAAITVVDPTPGSEVRRLEWETKDQERTEPVYFRIADDKQQRKTWLEMVKAEEVQEQPGYTPDAGQYELAVQ